MRRSDDDPAQPDDRALEQLQISRLLLAEASAKRLSGEIIEAMELREEARARRRDGLSMLTEATTTGEPQSLAARR
jgi:hypothetical protein